MQLRSTCGWILAAFVLAGSVSRAFARPLSTDPPGEILALGQQLRVPFPSAMHSGAHPARESASGDFNGDLRADVAQLIDTRLWLVSAPSVLQAYAPLSTTQTVNAITVVHGAARYGLDLIVSAEAGGLYGWELGTDGVTFERRTIDSTWRDVELVHAADVDFDGREDLIAYGGSPATVRVLGRLSSGAFSELGNFTPTNAPLALRAVDWTPSGSGGALLELALMSANALQVVSLAGAPRATFTSPTASVACEALRESGHPSLAWITKTADGFNEWFRLYEPGVTPAAGFALGPLRTVGMLASDLDDDGDLDITFTFRYSPHFALLFNGRRQATFIDGLPFSNSTSMSYVFPIADEPTSMADQAAAPCVDDFDGDGDQDVFVAIQGTHGFALQRGGVVADESSYYFRSYGNDSLIGEANDELVLGLPAVVPEEETEDAPAATHVELTIYERESTNDGFDAQPVEYELIPLATIPSGPYADSVRMHAGRTLASHHHQLHVRLVALDESGTLVHAWPDTSLSVQPPSSNGIGLDGLIGGTTPLPNLDPNRPNGGIPPPPPPSPANMP